MPRVAHPMIIPLPTQGAERMSASRHEEREDGVAHALFRLSGSDLVRDWESGDQVERAAVVGEAIERRLATSGRDLRHALAGGAITESGSDGASVTLSPVRDKRGRLVGFARVTRAPDGQARRIGELEQTFGRMDLALSSLAQGVCLLDPQGRVLLTTRPFEEILALAPHQLAAGRSISSLLDALAEDGEAERPAGLPQLAAITAETLAPNEEPSVEIRRQGRSVHLRRRALPRGGWILTAEDVTERRLIESKVEQLQSNDTLTSLRNRTRFRQRLRHILSGQDEGETFALLHIDLDRFKSVNDMLGHDTGDVVLYGVGARIQSQLRKGDEAARLSGDEFAVILHGCADPVDAVAVAQRLIEEIRQPFEFNGLRVTVQASIGVVMAPLHGGEIDVLMGNSDLALYVAKTSNEGKWCVYDPQMKALIEERRKLKRDLIQALEGGEFVLHFQPLVRAATGEISGFEALLRWKSPERGLVPPGDFIPFAEEIDLMPRIGIWVLEEACRIAASWPQSYKLAVNLSPVQFRAPALVEQVAAALRRSGLDPARLELEVTETAMITDIPLVRRLLEDLRALGVAIAMDDFGTGYSSLSFIRVLPFTRIKIDQSFVRDLGHSPEATAIVRAVTGLCGSLGVGATAEGVETQEQFDALKREGCDEIQGFLVSPALPAEALSGWIARYEGRRPKLVPHPAVAC